MVDESMSQFDKPFDPGKEEGTPARNLVPPGKYKAEVVDVSLSRMKNGKGTLLNLSWQITEEGEWNARYVFQSMVHTHSESKDAEIWGRRRIKDLCDACGIREAVTDLSVFQYKPCIIQVGIERDRNGEYPDKNRVTAIKPVIVINTPLPKSTPQINGGADPSDSIPF